MGGGCRPGWTFLSLETTYGVRSYAMKNNMGHLFLHKIFIQSMTVSLSYSHNNLCIDQFKVYKTCPIKSMVCMLNSQSM